jgi:cytochrome c peroxidase
MPCVSALRERLVRVKVSSNPNSLTSKDPAATNQPVRANQRQSVMDVTQLRGISRTAPYFHNNSASTLEEVLDHYDAFFRSVVRQFAPPNLPAIVSSNGTLVDRGFIAPEEREALLAYLRKL